MVIFPDMTEQTLFARLRDDSSANVLTMTAMLMPVMIGAAGLGVDTVQWSLTQRQLQRMADTAAIAGALANSQGKSAKTGATAALGKINLVKMSQSPVIETPPSSGAYTKDGTAIRVILATSKPLPFSSLFLKNGPLIKAQATAAFINSGQYCVLSFENSAAGITMQGGTSVTMGCGMATNSNASIAVTTGGQSTVSVSQVAAVGGLKSSVNYAPGTILLPHSKAWQDPLASLPNPTKPSQCNKPTQLSVQPNTTVNVSAPGGVACFTSMNLKGNVTFAPGTYYINGGSLSIAANAVVKGSGVTFILKDFSGNSSTTVDISGSASVNLTAPTSGTYGGILFYQPPTAPSNGKNTISGNTNSKLEGAVYLPNQQVTFAGTTGMDTKCLQIVARTVAFSGASTIQNDCSGNPAARAFSGSRASLVE